MELKSLETGSLIGTISDITVCKNDIRKSCLMYSPSIANYNSSEQSYYITKQLKRLFWKLITRCPWEHYIHWTLTFHSTGISAKNVTLGLPRLKELINVSKKLKSPTLSMYMTEIEQRNDNKLVNENIKNSIEYKTFRDLVKVSRIVDRSINDNNVTDIINLYEKCPGTHKFEKFILKIEFDVSMLEYSQITLFDIYDKIVTNKKIKHDSVMSNIFIMMNDDNSENPMFLCNIIISDQNSEPADDEQIIQFLKHIEVEYLNKIIIQGINGITKVFISDKKIDYWTEEKGFIKKEIKCIEAEGSNLLESFKINNVDHRKTISNNIIEIYEVLGIEAARLALLNELKMVLSFDGSYVNYRHLSMLVDIMTYKGILMSITRHGINRIDTGTLMKCSFEETVEILTESAMYSQRDIIKGVSENIMLGQLVPCGTGVFDVVMSKHEEYEEESEEESEEHADNYEHDNHDSDHDESEYEEHEEEDIDPDFINYIPSEPVKKKSLYT